MQDNVPGINLCVCDLLADFFLSKSDFVISVFRRPGNIWEPPKQRMNRSFWRSVPSDSEYCGRAAEHGSLLDVWCHKDHMAVMSALS